MSSDEHVYWRGQPDPKKLFGPGDLYLVPFTLLWGGFAIFWEVGATASGFYFGSVFGLFFVGIGLYLIFGRFVYKRWIRNRTRYCITDQRIIVARRSGRNVQSVPLDRPLRVARNREGRRGTLMWQIPGWQPSRTRPFGSKNSSLMQSMSESGWPGAGQSNVLSFSDIPDVDQALKQLDQAMRATWQGPSGGTSSAVVETQPPLPSVGSPNVPPPSVAKSRSQRGFTWRIAVLLVLGCLLVLTAPIDLFKTNRLVSVAQGTVNCGSIVFPRDHPNVESKTGNTCAGDRSGLLTGEIIVFGVGAGLVTVSLILRRSRIRNAQRRSPA